MISRRDFIKATTIGGALASVGNMASARKSVEPMIPDPAFCHEAEKKIPIIRDADVVIAGGSSAAVAAAVAAKKAGCSVFLVAYMPYLGDDICGSFQYFLKKNESPRNDIARKIFYKKNIPTPLQVKTILEKELIDNGIDFLYSSYVTNVLTDKEKNPCGVIIANRSGRQVVRCKTLVDATTTAAVASMAAVSFTPFEAGEQTFYFTTVGNPPKKVEGADPSVQTSYKIKSNNKEYTATQYAFKFPMTEWNYAALMEIEQTVRDRTWNTEQNDSSDLLWYIPPFRIKAEKDYEGEFKGVRSVPLESLQAKGRKNLFVLGPCAGVSRSVASEITRPVYAMELGEYAGELAALTTTGRDFTNGADLPPSGVNTSDYGQVKECLLPLRKSKQSRYSAISKTALPVLGQYDVVVMGGGTAGAAAGISASRQGVKTLVLEYLHGLGGLTTLGLIGRYWDGFREGFTHEIDAGVKDMAPADHPLQKKNWTAEWNSDWKMEWLRKHIRTAGGEIWFGILGCGALVKGNKVTGIVVATPFGRGVILSNIVIDSTGSADIAIAAGASFDYTGKKTIAIQGAGFPKRDLHDFYNNTDWAFIDDTDILDVSRIYIQGKVKYQGRYDVGKMPQTRERRRVVGEHIVSVYDVINQRRYPDTISFHKSSFDTHGMTIDPFFTLSPPLERHSIYDADVPLRSLLPKGLDGILTTGLGASAHRDAMPVIRMQPCLQNQGYAVGYLSALCAKEKKKIRDLNIKKVQKHLVKIGNLPERVLTDKEFKGFGNKEMEAAALHVADNYKDLNILLTDTRKSIPLLEKQIARTSDPETKAVYASILCILGNKKHADILSGKIKSYEKWDKGWHYTGLGQFGFSLSRLDSLLIALGNTRDDTYIDTVIEKARMLSPEDYFSHFRAVAMAFEGMGSPKAVPVLYEMLTKPGMRNHHLDSYLRARNEVVPAPDDVSIRNKALKELHLARALYFCGDQDGLGKRTLEKYASGLQGHYARYASEILESV